MNEKLKLRNKVTTLKNKTWTDYGWKIKKSKHFDGFGHSKIIKNKRKSIPTQFDILGQAKIIFIGVGGLEVPPPFF